MLFEQTKQTIMRNKMVNAIAIFAGIIFSLICGYQMKNGIIVFIAVPSMVLLIKSWTIGTRDDNDVRWFSAFACTLCILIATI